MTRARLAHRHPAAPRSRSPRRRVRRGGEFDPSQEFEQHEWIPIHLGPLDLSITKAVAYLILGSVLTILLGWFLMRWRLGTDPDRRQTVGEWVYEITQTQIAEQGLPTKAIGRWFPYVASLMLFIWVVNMLGFIPLPLSDEVRDPWHEVPTLGDLRRDLVAVRDARARADDVRLHAYRGDPLERRRRATSRAGSPRCRRRCCR